MKTVIEMAREAGISLCFRGHPDRPERTKNNELTYWAGVNQITLKAFAELVRADAIADEREACAKVCDEYAMQTWADYGEYSGGYGDEIRKRSNT